MTKTFASAAAIGILVLAQAVHGVAQQSTGAAPLTAPPLLIDSGDLVEVSIYDNQDLSGRYRVNEDGNIILPFAGAVHLAGETSTEAGKTIAQSYVKAEILNGSAAQVSVFISEYATQGILVNGEVRNPGLYPALGVRTLNDMVTAAGGALPTGSQKVIVTRKSDPANPIKVEYNAEALTPEVKDFQIFPGDTITIPVAGSVYVLGGVSRSGIYILEGRHTLTVEKAMALAGGSTHGAAIEHAHIVRSVGNGKKEDITLNLAKIYKGKAPDIALKDGDIFYIPISTTKIVLEQAIITAIGLGSTVLTYRVAYQ